jgi:hypothetical protein
MVRTVRQDCPEKAGWLMQYAAAAYNRWRIPKLRDQIA